VRDDEYIPDAEAYDRFLRDDPHDFGPPPPRYTGEQLAADVFKMATGMNRLASGHADPRDPDVAKAIEDQVVRDGLAKLTGGGN
jgi:hypothetical protein